MGLLIVVGTLSARRKQINPMQSSDHVCCSNQKERIIDSPEQRYQVLFQICTNRVKYSANKIVHRRHLMHNSIGIVRCNQFNLKEGKTTVSQFRLPCESSF